MSIDSMSCYRQQEKVDVELWRGAGEIGKGGAIGNRGGLDEVRDRERDRQWLKPQQIQDVSASICLRSELHKVDTD